MTCAFQIKNNLLRAKSELLDVKVDLKFGSFLRAATKAGFNPDQPRDDDGKWAGADNSDDTATDAGASSIDGGATDFSSVRRRAIIDYSNALTGISTVDDITISLGNTLGRTMETMDFIPEWTPQVYGTAVHVAFGTTVRLEGLRGIGFTDVEHSFINGEDATHGEAGSIRTDVVLRNDIGDIIAIYDVKTGRSGLSPARVREIREHTGVQSNVPIIELSVERGARIKSISSVEVIIGHVVARLWRGSVL